jgi:hypothetical protein
MFLFRGRETNLRRHSIRLGADRDEGEGSHAIYTALPSCAAPLRGGASGRPQTPMPVWVDVEPLKSPFVARLRAVAQRSRCRPSTPLFALWIAAELSVP